MPIRGPQVFESLQHARARIQKEIHAFEGSANEFDQKMNRLVSRRNKDFVDLARHYLPELSSDSAEHAFEEIRSELVSLFEQKQRHQGELSQSIERSEQSINDAQTETDRVTAELNEKAQQRDRLQELAANQLKQIPEFEQLTNDAARAEQRLTTNESRMEQLNQEASENLPSFNKSRLFRYLYDRRFGTNDYHSRGLTRRIDRWLARYIDYANARRNYEFLTVTPELMSAELERRRDQFNRLMDRIEATESRIEQEVGLTDVIAAGDRLGEQRDALVVRVEDQNHLLSNFKSELEALRKSNGQYYDEALTKMRGHLQSTEAIILQRRARQTLDPKDDQIVNDIVGLNGQIGELQPGIQQLVGQRRALVEKQAELDDIIRRFRSSNFDSSRSEFANDLRLSEFVDRFLNNNIDVGSLWKHIRKRQQFQKSWAQQTSTDIVSSPSAQIVLHTMFNLATQALKNSAQRSVYRRGSPSSGGISWPSGSSGSRSSSRKSRRPSTRSSSSRRRSSSRKKSGGFTTGNGF